MREAVALPVYYHHRLGCKVNAGLLETLLKTTLLSYYLHEINCTHLE